MFLFGWWVSLAYLLVGLLMFITITGVPYGRWAIKQRMIILFIINSHILLSFIFYRFRKTLLEVVLLLPVALWQVYPRGNA